MLKRCLALAVFGLANAFFSPVFAEGTMVCYGGSCGGASPGVVASCLTALSAGGGYIGSWSPSFQDQSGLTVNIDFDFSGTNNGYPATGHIDGWCTITADCDFNQTTLQCGEPECEANPPTAPEPNMHWDSQDCRWEFDNCTTEAPLDSKDGMWAGTATGCYGGCVWNPYNWSYSGDHWVTNWRQTGFQCNVADEGEYDPPIPPEDECEIWEVYVDGQCQNPTCGQGYHWDETTHSCIADDPDPTDCPAGEHYVAGVGCVTDPGEETDCVAGTHWDSTLKRCVGDTTTPPPPDPQPGPTTIDGEATGTTTNNWTSTTVTNADGSQTTTGSGSGTMSLDIGLDLGFTLPEGDNLVLPPSDDDTFSEVFEEFWARVAQSPLFSGIAAAGDYLTGGDCPFPSFDLLGTSMSFEPLCDMWIDISAGLRWAWLAFYALSAAIIIWSA